MAKVTFLLLILFSSLLTALYSQTPYGRQWPQFRGPYGTGIVENPELPVSWNMDSLRNIRWKTTIPGLGHSCPVIWDNFLFVTTAVSDKADESLKVGLYGDIDMASDSAVMEFRVYCLDKNTGEILWERVAHKGIPRSRRHTKSSQANSTPAVDGKHLVVSFGSEGLYCYDFSGNLFWKKDMGILNPGPYTDPGVEWGYASSPVIYRDRIIIQADIPLDPFICVLDVETGREIWRTSRGDEVSTWCTPAICTEGGKTQVVANGYRRICGYDFDTGRELWRLSNGGDAPAPTPVVAHGLIYLNSAHGKFSPVFAVRPEATGDITLQSDSTRSRFIVWSIQRGGAYMQTPLVYGDYLYNLQVNGALTCFNAGTGEVKYRQSFGDAFSASGIASDGKIYFTSETGSIFVIQAGPDFRLLARNEMGDICIATPAISGNSIYFRTRHYLVSIGK